MSKFDSHWLREELHLHLDGVIRLEDNVDFGKLLHLITLEQTVSCITEVSESYWWRVDLDTLLRGAMYRNIEVLP